MQNHFFAPVLSWNITPQSLRYGFLCPHWGSRQNNLELERSVRNRRLKVSRPTNFSSFLLSVQFPDMVLLVVNLPLNSHMTKAETFAAWPFVCLCSSRHITGIQFMLYLVSSSPLRLISCNFSMCAAEVSTHLSNKLLAL